MANVSISEIQSAASSLSDGDLLLISKSNGDNRFSSVKCTFDTLFKSIAPCSECRYHSEEMTRTTSNVGDIVKYEIITTKNAYISIDIHNLQQSQTAYSHHVQVAMKLANHTSDNSIDNKILLPQDTMLFFGLGLFAANSHIVLLIPDVRVTDTTKCYCEYTYH